MAEQQKSQRGANLTQADRERGGRVSAAKQMRDARGKFAGVKKNHQRDQRQEDQDQNRQHKSKEEENA